MSNCPMKKVCEQIMGKECTKSFRECYLFMDSCADKMIEEGFIPNVFYPRAGGRSAYEPWRWGRFLRTKYEEYLEGKGY